MKITLLLTSIIATVSFVSCGTIVYLPKLPKEHVEIHVKYKDFSWDDYNKLEPLVSDMAEGRSVDSSNNRKPTCFSNGSKTDDGMDVVYDGFMYLVYKPNHPIPNQAVEEAMQNRLGMFLRGRKIAPGSATLQLLYTGKEEINNFDGYRPYKLVRRRD